MAPSSTKKTAKPEGEAGAPKKPRATKASTPKDPAAKPAKKTPTKEKVSAKETPAETVPVPPSPTPVAEKPAAVKAAPVPVPSPAVTPAIEAEVDESKIIQMKPPIQVPVSYTHLTLPTIYSV